MNSIALTGNLVRSPEARESSVSCLAFTIAVNRRFKNKNGERETDFFDCVAWGKLAEVLAGFDLQKGTTLAVVGSMQSRKWQDKQGNNRIGWSVNADDVQVIGGKTAAPAEQAPLQEVYDDNSDLPWA